MADARAELMQLRRLAELEAKASGVAPSAAPDFSNVSRPDGSQYDPNNPTVGMSGLQRFAAGAGKFVADTGRGIGQMMGRVSEEEIAAARERDAPLMNTGAGMAGNIAGGVATFLPTAFIPGANTVTGSALIGAGAGLLAPTVEGESRLNNAALGGAAGAAGGAIAKGLSRALNPQTSQSARQLISDGITPTPGQTLGGFPRRIEEAAKNIPFVGEGIRNAERRGLQDFNRSALNRVLAPIGKKSTSIGNEGVEQARVAVGQYYDDALASLKRVDVDDTFRKSMTKINNMTRTLPKNVQKQFQNIVVEQLDKKITPAGTMSADQFKTVTSEMGKLAQGYKSATNSFDQNQLGDALFEIRRSLMDLAGRNNPAAKTAISKADKAYAQLLRVEQAAKGAQEGVFTPAQLATAARVMDKSSRKVASAQGKALMQDFAQDGRNVLANKLPDSGTAERAIFGASMLGGGYAFDPMIAAGLAGGAGAARLAYTAPAQKAIVALLAQRPELARVLGGGMQRLIAPAAITGAVTQGAQ